jgi:two-component system nitrate/nitrite response regulator NarL
VSPSRLDGRREGSSAASGLGESVAPARRRVVGGHARVAVVSYQRLVRDALRVALLNRGFSATDYRTPIGPSERWELSRRLEKFGAVAGIIVCDVDDPLELRESTAVVSGIRLRWLVITASTHGPGWGAMVAAGAFGVVPMSAGLDQLAQAVKTVITGKPVMRESTRARVLQQWRAEGLELGVLAERLATLTPREMQILDQLRDGVPVKAIAKEAGVTEGTVRSQVKSVLRKLGVTSQLGAVAAYRRVGDASGAAPRADR